MLRARRALATTVSVIASGPFGCAQGRLRPRGDPARHATKVAARHTVAAPRAPSRHVSVVVFRHITFPTYDRLFCVVDWLTPEVSSNHLQGSRGRTGFVGCTRARRWMWFAPCRSPECRLSPCGRWTGGTGTGSARSRSLSRFPTACGPDQMGIETVAHGTESCIASQSHWLPKCYGRDIFHAPRSVERQVEERCVAQPRRAEQRFQSWPAIGGPAQYAAVRSATFLLLRVRTCRCSLNLTAPGVRPVTEPEGFKCTGN